MDVGGCIRRPEPGFEPGSWDPQSHRMTSLPYPGIGGSGVNHNIAANIKR